MKIEEVNADEAREVLRSLGLTPMDGSGDNSRGEFWMRDGEYPVFLPYPTPHRKEKFVKQSFEEIIDQITPDSPSC